MKKGQKEQVNIKLDVDVLNQVDGIVNDSYFYATRTHFIEIATREKVKRVLAKKNGGGLS